MSTPTVDEGLQIKHEVSTVGPMFHANKTRFFQDSNGRLTESVKSNIRSLQTDRNRDRNLENDIQRPKKRSRGYKCTYSRLIKTKSTGMGRVKLVPRSRSKWVRQANPRGLRWMVFRIEVAREVEKSRGSGHDL